MNIYKKEFLEDRDRVLEDLNWLIDRHKNISGLEEYIEQLYTIRQELEDVGK
jgi:hypothetical protein